MQHFWAIYTLLEMQSKFLEPKTNIKQKAKFYTESKFFSKWIFKLKKEKTLYLYCFLGGQKNNTVSFAKINCKCWKVRKLNPVQFLHFTFKETPKIHIINV